MPDTIPINILTPAIKIIMPGLLKSDTSLPVTSSKNDCIASAINNANKQEIQVTSTDSDKNCPINCAFLTPIIFLMPTSRARVTARAVARLI